MELIQPIKEIKTMKRKINISYRPTSSFAILQIPVGYEIITEGETKTVNCMLQSPSSPDVGWMTLKKFSITSVWQEDRFVPLYNELNDMASLECNSFINKTFSEIMKKEEILVYEM
jgi:hypothetical protein